MAATALTASTRYIDPEVTKIYFVSTMSDYTSPTRGELDGGIDVTGEVAEANGWNTTSESVDTPDLGVKFTKQIDGRISSEASSLTFYADINGVDARTILPRGTTGYIVWLDGGDIAANKMDVYPVSVRSVGKMRSVGNEAARLQISFSITDVPAEDVAVPA